jgi:hypothetical protein
MGRIFGMSEEQLPLFEKTSDEYMKDEFKQWTTTRNFDGDLYDLIEYGFKAGFESGKRYNR